jgi:hypothetical protein
MLVTGTRAPEPSADVPLVPSIEDATRPTSK